MKKIIQIMTLLVMSQLAIAQERLKGCIVSSAAQEREFKDKPYLKQTMSKSLYAAKAASIMTTNRPHGATTPTAPTYEKPNANYSNTPTTVPELEPTIAEPTPYNEN